MSLTLRDAGFYVITHLQKNTTSSGRFVAYAITTLWDHYEHALTCTAPPDPSPSVLATSVPSRSCGTAIVNDDTLVSNRSEC